jgi:hypothetical protein
MYEPDANKKQKKDESVKDQGGVGSLFGWKGIVHHQFVPRW